MKRHHVISQRKVAAEHYVFSEKPYPKSVADKNKGYWIFRSGKWYYKNVIMKPSVGREGLWEVLRSVEQIWGEGLRMNKEIQRLYRSADVDNEELRKKEQLIEHLRSRYSEVVHQAIKIDRKKTAVFIGELRRRYGARTGSGAPSVSIGGLPWTVSNKSSRNDILKNTIHLFDRK